jgi:hypothetical protein
MERKLESHHLWKEVSRNFKADHFLKDVKFPVSGGKEVELNNFTRTERGSKQLTEAEDRN